MKPRAVRIARIGAIAVVVGGLVVAQRLGAFEHFQDPECFRRALIDLGPWGYLAFLAAFAAFQPFGVPGMVFVIAASLIWPWPVAYGLSMMGTMISTSLGFAFARFVARDWVASMIPARFEKWNDALTKRAFLTIFVLRTFFLMQPLLHAFFGISKVRFWTHTMASVAGYAVPLLLISFFGQKVFDALRNAPPYVWVLVVVGTLLGALVFWAVRQRKLATDRAV